MQVLRFITKHKFILVLSLLYGLLALSFIWGNGEYSCLNEICGVRIGGWHLHDAMWHLSLVKMAFNEWPFVHPEYSGALLSGYNYLLDLLIYVLSRLGLNSFTIFFKLLPLLFIPLYTYLLVAYGLRRNNSPLYIACLLFFMYFGSSFTYLITLIYNHSLYYSSMKGFPVVTSIQPGLMFLNIQYAYSLAAILGILLLLKGKASLKRNILIGLLVFVATGLKFYGGAIAVGIIALESIFNFVRDHKLVAWLSLVIPSILLSFVAYLLFYKTAGEAASSPFVFAPFAIVHLMIEDPLLFYNQNLTLARYYLYEHGISPRLIAIETYSLVLFALLNFGSRIFAIPLVLYRLVKRQIKQTDLVFIIVIATSFLIPVLFVQDGGWYNTMQFTYYGVFLASFFAADWLYALLNKKVIWSITLGIILMSLTLPNSFEQLRYLSEEKVLISQDELAALAFLENQSSGSVFLSNSYKKSAYISAFSGKPTFFADIDQLMVTHVDYGERERLVQSPKDIDPRHLNVRYWYLLRADPDYPVIKSKLAGIEGVVASYSSGTVEIYTNTRVE